MELRWIFWAIFMVSASTLLVGALGQRAPRTSDLALLARGATFPAPLYQQWYYFGLYYIILWIYYQFFCRMLAFVALRGNNISFSYIPSGSGDGQRSILDCNPQCVDFAGSDAVLAEEVLFSIFLFIN